VRVKRVILFRYLSLVLTFLGVGFLGRQVNVWSAASENAGKLLITEVSFRDSANDWVELYVVDGSVNWSNYRFFEGGTKQLDFGSAGVSFETGDYIVLHEESGTDDVNKSDNNAGYWDFYGMTDLAATDGCLQIKEPSGSTDRVDVVIYSDNNDTFSSSEIEANGAVTDGMWDSGASFFDGLGGDEDAWTDSDDIAQNETVARFLDPGTPVFADSNSKENWYREQSPTKGNANTDTLIELASFTAMPYESYVQVEWETASEIDNAGFNLWRSDGGEYLQLNAALIPAQGGPTQGAYYEYQDATAANGVIYYYKLEDVDIHGVSTFHGPVWTMAGSMPSKTYRLYLPLLVR